jgi:hypothetical protein
MQRRRVAGDMPRNAVHKGINRQLRALMSVMPGLFQRA